MKFGGVVVRYNAAKSQLIVSAGGTVFGLRYTGGAALADDSASLDPGDQVTVNADVGKTGLDAGEGDVKETGHTGQVKIVGIFLRGGNDGFDVAIVHRGQVRVHFTLGTQLPAWQPGDVIVLLVTVNDDGSFTLVQGNTDHDPSKSDDGNKSGDDSGKTTTADLRGRVRRPQREDGRLDHRHAGQRDLADLQRAVDRERLVVRASARRSACTASGPTAASSSSRSSRSTRRRLRRTRRRSRRRSPASSPTRRRTPRSRATATRSTPARFRPA